MKEYKDFMQELKELTTITDESDKVLYAQLITIIVSFAIFVVMYGIIFIL